MNMQTTTLKNDTEFTTGYRGRGLPTLSEVVKAGTVVRYSVVPLNDGSKIYTAYHPTKRDFVFIRRVEAKKSEYAIPQTDAGIQVYDRKSERWLDRGRVEIPTWCVKEEGRLVGTATFEASEAGFHLNEWPDELFLSVGMKEYFFKKTGWQNDTAGDLIACGYEGVGPALKMSLTILND